MGEKIKNNWEILKKDIFELYKKGKSASEIAKSLYDDGKISNFHSSTRRVREVLFEYKANVKFPKVLIFDIETAPIKAYS